MRRFDLARRILNGAAVFAVMLAAASCSGQASNSNGDNAAPAVAESAVTTTTEAPTTTAAPTTTKARPAPTTRRSTPTTSAPRAVPTTRRATPTTRRATPTTAAPARNCDPAYPDVCLHDGIGDYDCAGGSGNGPNYVSGPIRVRSPDPFGLDADGDGVGCES